MPTERPRYERSNVALNDPNTSHAQLVLLTGTDKRVLEVGPASGYVSEALKRRGCTVVGLELDPMAAVQAGEFCDRIIVGDIERLDLGDVLGAERFDVIMFGDVLEHLVDPWRILREIRQFLEPGGSIVASVPNVAHLSLRLSLLAGRFTYSETGLLDRTHLRFFTRSSLESLFASAGYQIDTWRHTRQAHVDDSVGELFPRYFVDALLNDQDATIFQYLVVARPVGTGFAIAAPTEIDPVTDPPPPAVLEEMRARDERTDALGLAFDKAQKELDKRELLLRGLSRELNHAAAERDRAKAERDRATAEHDQAAAERDRATAERDRATAERDRATAERDRATTERDRATTERDRATAERDRATAEQLNANLSLQALRDTPGYEMLEAARRVAQRVAPPGGLRWRSLLLLSRALSYLVVAGPLAFLRHLVQPWTWGKPRAYSKDVRRQFSAALDPSTPSELAVGRGAVLVVKAWCVNSKKGPKGISLVVDGAECKTSVRRGVPAVGFPGEPQTMPGNIIWALVNLPPCEGERDLQISLRLSWRDGHDDRIALGSVRLLPGIRPDSERLRTPNSAGADAPLVCICMATYNPPLELFRRQIDSIRAQTHTNWRCIISDDASDPAAIAAIRRLVRGDPRFQVHRNAKRLGFYRNFESCLSLVPNEAQFVALSDHDDCWHHDKLEALLAGFDDRTMLVYSDMNIVDTENQLQASTYWTTRLNNHTNLTSLVIANTITGASSMFRRTLLDLALPFPQKVDQWSFHDQWLGAAALSLGAVGYIGRPLYEYVQHGGNVIGHFAPGRRDVLTRVLTYGRGFIERRASELTRWQSTYLYDVLRARLIALTLLARLDRMDAPVSTGRRAELKRLSQLGTGPRSFFWLLVRGVPSIGRRSVTLGLEYNMALGVLWLGLSRIRQWLGRDARVEVLPPHLAPAVLLPRNPFPERPESATPDVLSEDALVTEVLSEATGPAAIASSAQMLGEVHFLAERIEPLRLKIDRSAPQRVNILIATVDANYFFGGYIAIFNLARKLAHSGRCVRIVVLDPCDFAPDRWRTWLREFNGLDKIVDEVEFCQQYPRSRKLVVNPADAFVATVWWTAHLAHAAARALGKEGFVFLIQEYEPVFYPMGSMSALAAQSYDFPQYALFSTDFLRGYFREHAIGIYRPESAQGEDRSISFRNAITPVCPPSIEELSGRRPRHLLFYARPESHASRNMFELGVLGLAQAIQKGYIPSSWDLSGIGTIGGDRPIEIARGRDLNLLNRRTPTEYGRLLSSCDVGLSLMLTPHPSLVPIEMASAGMLAVTNTFGNKDAASLAKVSANIIGAEPTADGICDSLRDAVERAEDLPARIAGSHVDWPRDWDRALDASVVGRLGEFLDYLMQPG
jgi:2-polyprenyl-3-methyl-5-hydroxy-6-metoxy-1,4-benzoquinol methylase/glycosyltransferase involved in cell wall biosynthesis